MNNKYIHYCWFGRSPLPDEAKKCIESWKRFMPDYKIIRWDESNYDISKCNFAKEAYEAGKYAFVSDFARFDILYKYGGLYLDTDVEIIKPFDKLIKSGPFMGMQSGTINDLIQASKRKNRKCNAYVAPGLVLYAKPRLKLYKEILDYYQKEEFVCKNSRTLNELIVVNVVTNILLRKKINKSGKTAICDGIRIYPPEYFNPLGEQYRLNRLTIVKNTHSIHHYRGSWLTKKEKKWMEKIQKKKTILGKTKFKKYEKKLSTKIATILHNEGLLALIKKTIKKLQKKCIQ